MNKIILNANYLVINALTAIKNKKLFNKTSSFLQVRSKIKEYEANKYKPYFYLIDNQNN